MALFRAVIAAVEPMPRGMTRSTLVQLLAGKHIYVGQTIVSQ